MSETPDASRRIDAALARIAAAFARRGDALKKLEDRHESLRAQVVQAIAAIDALTGSDG